MREILPHCIKSITGNHATDCSSQKRRGWEYNKNGSLPRWDRYQSPEWRKSTVKCLSVSATPIMYTHDTCLSKEWRRTIMQWPHWTSATTLHCTHNDCCSLEWRETTVPRLLESFMTMNSAHNYCTSPQWWWTYHSTLLYRAWFSQLLVNQPGTWTIMACIGHCRAQRTPKT